MMIIIHTYSNYDTSYHSLRVSHQLVLYYTYCTTRTVLHRSDQTIIWHYRTKNFLKTNQIKPACTRAFPKNISHLIDHCDTNSPF